ncbi:VC2046/SO_2500 family protein [Vibrio sonorensis]|uniref:VC2046/SO_2500 family protein n=1 Tax=Vibrio sonorensis TaxID=1004316 RepID=UPI0008D91073|nr:VC2046/SO_2500 family protein [Vibrio sonorensis]
MVIHTLDKAGLINELQCGSGINHAVHEGRRADFALILSMFSNDVRDNTPVEQLNAKEITESLLRERFEIPPPQPLRSDEESYPISAKQAELFHGAGMSSAKLSQYLHPEPLCYLPTDTFDLPEEVYHNLSGHQRQHLAQPKDKPLMAVDLYPQMVTAQRKHQINTQV